MDQAFMLREMQREQREINASRLLTSQRRPIRVVAITSGKGGVGKTNITVNLAYLLSKMKKRALILDADTGLANVDLILGLTPQYSLYHVLKGERTIAETIIKGAGGIMVLPASSGILEMADFTPGQKLTLLGELNTLNKELDFMFLDTAAGIAGNVLFFNAAAREIIVLVSPETTSLTDAYALIKILYQRHAKKRFRLLVNMVKNAAEAKEVYNRISNATDHFLNLTIDYLGYVLYDEKMKEAVRKQVPLVELYPRSPAALTLMAVAEKLYHENPEHDGCGNLEFFWEDMANSKNG